ncbi:ATP-binding protein [Gordonibacter sp. An230]|uniref:ATP-binding protein n=1 Tax=Gordonibacter sp. An230 TaxID=1965592 RepID=UPI001EF6DC3D|nr:ATP-binding protein [Gordonibacter sp. An230]
MKTPECIELANPGGFRVDVDKALAGGVSDPRNATMAKMFSLVEIGERAGSGLPKIVDGWRACGLPQPIITESFGPDRTVLVLPLETRRQKPAAKTGRITHEKEQAVIGFLASEGSAKTGEVAAALDLGLSRTREVLSGMVAKGIVVSEGTGRARAYRLPTAD